MSKFGKHPAFLCLCIDEQASAFLTTAGTYLFNCHHHIMGVKNGSKMLHKVTGLLLADISHVSKTLAASKGIQPQIVADCSNFLFIFSKSTSDVGALDKHLSKFASTGLVMMPVCDGKVCPI